MSTVFITCLAILIVLAIILYKKRLPGFDKSMLGNWYGEAKPGETRVLRGFDAEKGPIDYNVQHYETINDLVNGMTDIDQPHYIGHRKVLEEVPFKHIKTVVNGKEVDKVLYKYKMSEYQYFSNKEFQDLINHISIGIKNTGLVKGDRVAIFCETRYEWIAFFLACARQGIVCVTVYATLGDDSVKVALDETEVKMVLTSNDTFKRLCKLELNKEITVIKVDCIESDKQQTTRKVIDFNDLVNTEYTQEDINNLTQVTSTDLAIIMYTSGTSKEPKGVLVEQKQIMMLSYGYKNQLLYDNTVRMIAYLPLAHIFELCIELCVLMFKGTVGYANVRTLTSAGVIDSKSDLVELQPDIFIGVPTVFNRVRKAILENVLMAKPLKRKIFNFALNVKQKFYVDYDFQTPYLFLPLLKLVDAIVFNPIKKGLFGSNLHSIVVGGSALPSELQDFLNCVVPDCDVMQGFGMTELCGASNVMLHRDNTKATIGIVFPMYEIKLRDVPELGYFTTDNPPRGELMFRGLPVSKGYFNRPEESKQTFLEDGWIATGDVALITEDHHVCIIDRKKNIVKQPCGEYISLELIESKYNSNAVVDSICVFADAFHDFVIALILPNKKIVTDVAKENGIEGTFEELCKNEVIINKVKEMLKENESTITARQRIKHFTLESDEWTPENGLLTAALKLKRPAIQNKYKKDIDTMFALN